MNSSIQKLIVVIGMHRTGTSLVTRGLQVMGVSLGDHLLPAMEQVNAKGFWEDAEINALNIEMLAQLKCEWDSINPITAFDVELLINRGYLLSAVALLRERVAKYGLFGLKDPRIAKLMPFWVKVFGEAGYAPCYLMTIRNPLSVAKSLARRDGFEHEKSYYVWLTHVISALEYGLDHPLVITDYDYFMAHSRHELDRIAQAFSLTVNEQEMSTYLNEFVDTSLRHAQFTQSDLTLDPACPKVVAETYAFLLDQASSVASTKQLGSWLEEIKKRFQLDSAPFGLIDKLYTDKHQLGKNIVELESKLQVANVYLAQHNQTIATLEQFNRDREQQVAELNGALENLESVRKEQVENLNIAYENLESIRQEQVQKLLLENVASQDLVSQQQNIINQYKAEIANSKESIQLLDAHLKSTQETLAERDSNIVQIQAQLFEAQTQLLSLTSSLERETALLGRETALLESRTLELNYFKNYLEMVLQSRSWKITRPLRIATRLITRGVTEADKQALLALCKKGYSKLPRSIQSLVRPFGRRVFSSLVVPVLSPQAVLMGDDSQALTCEPTTEVSASAVLLAKSSEHDIFVWGVIDWHFRHQRPQQIAQALAQEGDRVFYVSSNLVAADIPGFAIEPLDKNGRLFQVNLCVTTPVPIYHHAPSKELLGELRASLGRFLAWSGSPFSINIVQHPFWRLLAESVPNSRLVYDCMDHHEGFENTGSEIIDLERALFKAADLTIVTSSWLDEAIAKYTARRVLIRNAGEYEYFSNSPASTYSAPEGQKVIGYYGAIAEWFDIELVAELAKTYSDALILLIGADTVNAQKALSEFHNVHFVGEVPYKELTHYLYAFDVCLLPFKVIPLILATNPVKVYEYLGAGKPVVAVDVPEIQQFGDLVLVGKDQKDFVTKVGEALAENQTANLIDARKKFASEQTWHHRAKAVEVAVKELVPTKKVSVILVTYNNLDLTKACLYSLDAFTQYENIEIIVVDNASADGTPDFLSEWVKGCSSRKIVLSPENTGFAAGNNMGLKIATGDYLILLNNDTYVTPGWISGLLKHLEQDESIGLIGPVTNNIGNESRINISYNNMEEMHQAARDFTLRHLGQLTPLRTAAFFCVMMSRATFEKVGFLDEAFGIGFFEDDDYCRRIEQAGLKVMCADDVFIHHHLSASFNKLKVEARQKLFEANKAVYEKKWGEWIPHKYRPGVF